MHGSKNSDGPTGVYLGDLCNPFFFLAAAARRSYTCANVQNSQNAALHAEEGYQPHECPQRGRPTPLQTVHRSPHVRQGNL